MVVKQRLSFEHLLMLQDVLDQKLVNEELTSIEYVVEWNSLLSSLGYDEFDYLTLLDERWDRLDSLRKSPSVAFGLA